MRRLVFARHGESTYNAEDRFTGWADPPLTAKGEAQARSLGDRLSARKLYPDVVFTSALQRTGQSAAITLQAMGLEREVFAEAALNERDYGELSGLGRVTASARWGAGQVRRWRRSYAECPPGGESLRDTAARALAAFLHRILPRVMVSDTTLVVAHGNSLRALIMALEGMSPEAVMDLELKPGEARVYTLGPDTAVVSCDLLII